MKQTFTIMFVALFGGIMTSTMKAQRISEEQALQKAQAFLQGKVMNNANGRRNAPGKAPELQRVAQATQGDAVYIFNAENNGGFVIISGDERMGDILGYGTEGNIDPDKMPVNMRAWLKGYEETINNEELVINNPDNLLRQGAALNVPAVAPLIKTKWGQGWPYNLMTPEVDGQHCVTGCVATSMAMVMNYWKYPATTAKEIPAWFGLSKVPAGTKIDWSNMSDFYSDNEWWNHFNDVEDSYFNELYPETTDQQKTAVAELMKMCGMAVNMDYGVVESNAQDIAPLSALKDYFGYKNEMKFLLQDNYTIDNWQQIIYHELEQKRPVMYGGIADDMAFQGGHSFLIDGYDGNGFFHINWGLDNTAGLIHGYYTLSAQRFYKQTSAIVGIQPTVGGSIANVPTVGAYTLSAINLTLTGVTTDGPVWAMDVYPGCGNVILTLKNNGSQLFKGLIWIAATDESGFTSWDDVLAEVPANGTAEVVVPYYLFQFDHGENIIHLFDYNTGQPLSGEFPITVERQRIPNLNIEYTLDGVDDKGLITYGTPCTLHYKITSQWAGDPTLKARLCISGLPSGEVAERELGTITYGKPIEGSVAIEGPSWNPLPDFLDFTISPRVEFYTDTRTNQYLQFFFQNGKQEGDSRTFVFCKKKPHFASKAVKADLEPLTVFSSDYNLRPAGYYVLGHDGFVGFNGMSSKDEPDLDFYYNSQLELFWKDYLEGVTFYTGILQCGFSTKKHLGVFDCPSDKPYTSGSITKTMDGKTVYFPCNVAGVKEAASRGLYKNEVGTFLPYEGYLQLLYSGSFIPSDNCFDDCYLYYYPIVEGIDGDVNGDSAVDVADIASIVGFMAGTPGTITMTQADVNGDGSVDVADISKVIDIMAGK